MRMKGTYVFLRKKCKKVNCFGWFFFFFFQKEFHEKVGKIGEKGKITTLTIRSF